MATIIDPIDGVIDDLERLNVGTAIPYEDIEAKEDPNIDFCHLTNDALVQGWKLVKPAALDGAFAAAAVEL